MAEAEAEMLALETSIDTYSEMAALENPPVNLVDFANEVVFRCAFKIYLSVDFSKFMQSKLHY